jgi:hypothetical protein
MQVLSILLLTAYERGYRLGQGLALPIVIAVVLIIYYRKKKKKKKENDDILDK